METKTKRKVTRKIKKFDFSEPEATVSLVGDSVGGPANGILTLITKSKKNFSEEFLQKASQITVTMDIVEYLNRFFGIWCDDAELLARSLGFTTPMMDDAVIDQQEASLDSQEPPEKPNSWDMPPDEYAKELDNYLNYKLQSISVMKSLFEADDIEKALLNLSEEDYLQVLKDQELVEQAFVSIDKACSKGKRPVKKNSTAIAEDASTNVHVENKNEEKSSVVKNKNKEGSMAGNEDVIAKAEFEAIKKQLEDQKAELQKANELVTKYETEKKEAIAKARKEQLTKACGKHSEVIFKALGECKEEDFVAVVKALSEMNELIEKSALFQEQGASVEDADGSQESNLAKVIKAKYSKKN